MFDAYSLPKNSISTAPPSGRVARPEPAGAALPRSCAAESRDAELLAAVVAWNDRAAFEELYHAHSSAVMRAAMEICRNPTVAEDIVQCTFIKLWERAARLAAKPIRLRSWLVTVARNAGIDRLRSEHLLEPLTANAGLPAQPRCPQDEAVANALFADVEPALAALSPEQRFVIERHYFAGQTFAVMARESGIPIGTLKSRARLAIRHLRRAVGESTAPL